MKYLYILLFWGCLVYDVSGSKTCKPQKEFCVGEECDREQECKYGTCLADGSCECYPCFKGESCGTYVDDHYPNYVKEEDTVYIETSHTGFVYQAEAVDTDTYTTCFQDNERENKPCPCGQPHYEIVGTYGSPDSPFYVNNLSGHVMLREGTALRSGEVYAVEVAVSNYSEEDPAYDTGVLSLDHFQLNIHVTDSNSIQDLLARTQMSDRDTDIQRDIQRDKYGIEWNSELAEAEPMVRGMERNMDMKIEREMNRDDKMEDNYIHRSPRVKRASFGADIADNNLTLEVVNDPSGVELNPGEKVDFKITMILPNVAEINAMDLLVELYAMDTVSGITTLALCDVNVESIGSAIMKGGGGELTTADVSIDKIIDTNFGTFHDRVIVNFGTVYNLDSVGTSGFDDSTILITFSAVMISNSAFTNTTAIITAGAEYDDENYVWVSQASFPYSNAAVVYPAAVEVSGPTNIPEGNSGTFDLTAFIVDPFSTIELEVFSPLHIADTFSVTSIGILSFGDNHKCGLSPQTKTVSLSASGKTNHRMVISFPLLVSGVDHGNLAAEETEAGNKMLVSFTILVVDAVAGDTIRVGAALRIGVSSLWTAFTNIAVDAATGTAAAVPVSVAGFYLDDRTTPPTVAAGGSVTYGMKVGLQPPGTPTTVTCTATPGTGNKICGVGYGASSKFAGSFPDLIEKVTYGDDGTATWTVEIQNGYTDIAAQGARVPADEFVVFEVTQIVTAYGPTGNIDCTGTAFTMDAQTGPAASEDLSGTVTDPGNDNKWYEGSHAAIITKLKFPPNGVSYVNIIETSADLSTTTFGTRVCAFDVMSIGRGAACAAKGASQLEDNTVHKQALTSSVFNDSLEVGFGEMCGSYLSDAAVGDDTFVFRITYDIPLAQGSVAATTGYSVSVGAMLNADMIWTGSSDFDITLGVPVTDEAKLALFTVTLPTEPIKEQIPQIIKAAIKAHPGSVAHYKVKVTSASIATLELCRIVFLNVGRNFPCFDKFPYGKHLDPQQTVKITHDATWTLEATMDLGILRNMGDGTIYGTTIADEDTIEMGIIVKPIGPSTSTDLTIEFIDLRTSVLTPTISAVLTTADVFVPKVSDPMVLAMNGKDGTLEFYADVIKEVDVTLKVPVSYGKVTYLEAVSEAPLDLTICYAAVTTVGMNVPCLIPAAVISTRTLGPGGEDIIKVDLSSICYIKLSDDPAENEAVVRVGVMVRSGLGTASFKVKYYEDPLSTTPVDEQTVTITLSASAYVNPPFDPTTITIAAADTTATTVEPGERFWLGVKITLPVGVTVPLTFGVLSQSSGGQADATVHGFRWGVTQGKNIACLQPTELYDTQLEQGAALDAVAMFHESQTDAMTVYLKHMTNTGITELHLAYVADDDILLIEADIWIADHHTLINGDTIKVAFSIKEGDTVIAVVDKLLTLTKPATSDVLVLKKELFFTDSTIAEDKVFAKGDQIELTGRVQHVVNESHKEAYLAKLRLMVPSYVKYAVTPAAAVADTYTVNLTTTTIDPQMYIDIDIAYLFFTDIVEFNISLTVDPHNDMPKGLGELNSTALFRVVCAESNPTAAVKYCGGPTAYVNYMVQGTECYEDLLVSSFTSCQLMASTAIDAAVDAHNAVTAAGWSPAVRDTSLWGHWISIDFLRKTRVTKITFTAVAGKRSVGTYKLMTSYDGIGYIVACTEIIDATQAELPDACRIETRYAKIKILTADDTNEEMAIGVSFTWFGCYLEDVALAGACTFGATPLTTGVDGWRHMALDPVSNVLYFCDYNPKKKRMECYSSADGATWNALPSYISSLAGFDAATGLMYAWDTKKRAKMASADGVQLALVDSGLVIAPTAPSPIGGGPKLGFTPVTLGGWEANFDGISLSGAQKVKWNSCCT